MRKAPAKRLRTRPDPQNVKASNPLLDVNGVGTETGGSFFLQGITFSVAKLEKIAIAGETGAGKSTLLKLIAGLAQPNGGIMMYAGMKVRAPHDHLVPGHPGIAYLSQHFELQKSLRVEQVLEYSNVLSDDEADRLYQVCQIGHLLKRRTDQLSGGEKQRVAICRLLISRPGLLLLDEPFSHLDMVHKNTLKEVIRNIGDKLEITCMLVSHDPSDTLPWADRIIVMRDGRIVQMDTPTRLYKTPVDEYTAGLFGKVNLIDRSEIRLFAKLRPVAKMKEFLDGGRVMIRPEQFRIVKKSDRALRARVERVMFFGSFREAEVVVSGKRLTVHTHDPDLRPGGIIYLGVGKENLWTV